MANFSIIYVTTLIRMSFVKYQYIRRFSFTVFLDIKFAFPIPQQHPLSLQTSLGDPGESGVLGGDKRR